MDSLPINVTDLAILVVMLVSGVFAFLRGFVQSLLSLGAWVGAAVVTVIALPFAQPYARELIASPFLAEMAAGVGIFIVVLVLISILTHWLSKHVRESSLGALDRSLGLLFGFLRGAVLVCLAWIPLAVFVPREDHPSWIAEARALPLVEQGAGLLISLVPENVIPELQNVGPDSPQGSPEETFDQLVNPGIAKQSGGPTKGAGPADGSGYKDGERKDLQRLIETSE